MGSIHVTDKTSVVHNGSGVHPAFDTVPIAGSFSGIKRLKREAHHSSPFVAQVNNGAKLLN
jgi:hypothetical protein